MVKGQKILAKGDAARGSLHNDTYYGAIAEPSTGAIRYVVRKSLSSFKKESEVKNIVDDAVMKIVQKAVAEKGFAKAMAEPIWMNEEKGVLIKKVRCYAEKVTNPLNIRHHRDSSDKEYKRQFHVANDRNYLMAIYMGFDARGREKRDFVLKNNLEAAEFYKSSTSAHRESLVPDKSPHGYDHFCTLRIGAIVLLYEKSPDEIWNESLKEIGRRLYKVTGLSSMVIGNRQYGVLKLTYHEEARPSTQVKSKNGAYSQGEELRPAITMLHTQINALVEGYDFRITETGKIIRLR